MLILDQNYALQETAHITDFKATQFMKIKLCLIICIAIVLLGILLGLMKINYAERPSDYEIIANSMIQQFPASMNSFKRDIGRYPTPAEGLDVLVKPTDSIRGKWRGPYIQASALVDPWGQKIAYKYSDEHDSYEIISAGPDGIFGTKDDIRYDSRPTTQEAARKAARGQAFLFAIHPSRNASDSRPNASARRN